MTRPSVFSLDCFQKPSKKCTHHATTTRSEDFSSSPKGWTSTNDGDGGDDDDGDDGDYDDDDGHGDDDDDDGDDDDDDGDDNGDDGDAIADSFAHPSVSLYWSFQPSF
ncbi:Hypothetical predicted protein [Marmota monax]|uniref:Uncharacterized protein n=1 Tax=Marmota monax TaxID=9995 RepID=A0A5E4BJP1_MARMO|nr:Hypothetical predicted protein [Marmota monax]